MMTLIRLLPFTLGHYIDENDEHWQIFLMLWDICSVITKYVVTTDLATKLAWMVEGYLEAIVDLYGRKAITPKMHHLVHLKEQMEL